MITVFDCISAFDCNVTVTIFLAIAPFDVSATGITLMLLPSADQFVLLNEDAPAISIFAL